MTRNIFQSSVSFTLCELQEDILVDIETITLRSLTIDAHNYLNSYIRQTYLTAQKDAIKEWDRQEQENYLNLAMRHIFRLGLDTKEGNDILFNNEEGILHYSWVFVRHHVKDGEKIYWSVAEWEKTLRSSPAAYHENMRRFNSAIIDIAQLTARETGREEELPLEDDTEYIDQLIATLLASGISMDDAKNMTIGQAIKVLEAKTPAVDKEPVFETNDPAEFKQALAARLSEQQA